jgi:hypothetical protein
LLSVASAFYTLFIAFAFFFFLTIEQVTAIGVATSKEEKQPFVVLSFVCFTAINTIQRSETFFIHQRVVALLRCSWHSPPPHPDSHQHHNANVDNI